MKISNRRLLMTADGKVVEFGDPRGRTLLVAVGAEITPEIEKKIEDAGGIDTGDSDTALALPEDDPTRNTTVRAIRDGGNMPNPASVNAPANTPAKAPVKAAPAKASTPAKATPVSTVPAAVKPADKPAEAHAATPAAPAAAAGSPTGLTIDNSARKETEE